MPSLEKVIKLTQEQYNTLASGGTVGEYTGLDSSYLYMVENMGDIIDISNGITSAIKEYIEANPSTMLKYNGYVYVPQYVDSGDTIPHYYSCLEADSEQMHSLIIDWDNLDIEDVYDYDILTLHQSIKTLNTTLSTSQSTSSSENIVGTGTINLHKIAKTGNYNDLLNKPTIPAAQVNADWNATSGVASILNKPTLGTAASLASNTWLLSTTNYTSKVKVGTSEYTPTSGVISLPAYPTDTHYTSTFTIYGGTTSVATFNQSSNMTLSIVAGDNITVTPDATNHKITISGTASATHYTSTWSVYADSTLVSTFNQSANRSITFKAGSNITLNATANSGIITISGTGDTHYASTFTIYGDSTSVATFNQSTNMTLSIVGGDNITLTKDATNHKITISGTANTTYTAQSGLSLSGTVFGHANTAITAQTTQAIYPIKIDAYGHITSYGTAVTIPTVNNATLTIQQNSTTVNTFTANASANVTANIITPQVYRYI